MEQHGFENANDNILRVADLPNPLERGLYNNVNAICMLRTDINMAFSDSLEPSWHQDICNYNDGTQMQWFRYWHIMKSLQNMSPQECAKLRYPSVLDSRPGVICWHLGAIIISINLLQLMDYHENKWPPIIWGIGFQYDIENIWPLYINIYVDAFANGLWYLKMKTFTKLKHTTSRHKADDG